MMQGRRLPVTPSLDNINRLKNHVQVHLRDHGLQTSCSASQFRILQFPIIHHHQNQSYTDSPHQLSPAMDDPI